MTEDPTQLEYATPVPLKRRPIRKSVIVGVIAIGFGMISLAVPPVVGSGRVSHHGLWTITWGVTFALLVAYVWLRLCESRPANSTGMLLAGVGSTGVLMTLALIWIDHKPNVRLLVVLCALSFVVATVGRWMTKHQRTG